MSQLIAQHMMQIEKQSRIVSVPVTPLTPSRFDRFGAVIESGHPDTSFRDVPGYMRKMEIAIDGTPELYIIRYRRNDTSVSVLEQHLHMTETRISLGGYAVLLVSSSDVFDNPGIRLSEEDFCAFLIKPSQGVILNRKVWHSLDCIPLMAPFADFAFITERESENELIAEQNFALLKRTRIVDLKERYGVTVRIAMPSSLASI